MKNSTFIFLPRIIHKFFSKPTITELYMNREKIIITIIMAHLPLIKYIALRFTPKIRSTTGTLNSSFFLSWIYRKALPVPFNPGSRPVFVGSRLFAFFRLRNIAQCCVISPFNFLPLSVPSSPAARTPPAPFSPGLPPPCPPPQDWAKIRRH